MEQSTTTYTMPRTNASSMSLAVVIFISLPLFSTGFATSTTLTPGWGTQKTTTGNDCLHRQNNEAPVLHSKLFGPDEDFDEAEGQALANKFYEQLREREQQQQQSSVEQQQRDDYGDAAAAARSSTPPKKKFTGMKEPVISTRSGASSSNGRRSPRDQMMEREFQLVGRAERGLKYQAGLAVFCLIFYLYVGLTGGITSNSNTEWSIEAEDDPMVEQIMPVPRDSEASYWL